MKSIFLVLFFLPLFVFSEDSKNVIDLGQTEVQGELRRPTLEWVDSGKGLKKMFPRLHEEQFYKLEQKLTKPMKLEEFRKRSSKEN